MKLLLGFYRIDWNALDCYEIDDYVCSPYYSLKCILITKLTKTIHEETAHCIMFSLDSKPSIACKINE